MIEVAALRLFCNKISHSQRASNTSVSSAFSCKTVREGDSHFSLLASISIHSSIHWTSPILKEKASDSQIYV